MMHNHKLINSKTISALPVQALLQMNHLDERYMLRRPSASNCVTKVLYANDHQLDMIMQKEISQYNPLELPPKKEKSIRT